eukprot:gnl/TRDRNA2_/TRDRNA2_175180_c0_seq10.p1 gnl/TRDRNA2_/TRDRNA2_175180_c0~~gnl/TRDRNA2_/TRDRNA2_175180_c0_seq10.p1  ORF type:complete len:299 (-),score=20.46 gnl/TRDRNA2_/TRDRNA2_175180_c0_seq10:209-1105(-)
MGIKQWERIRHGLDDSGRSRDLEIEYDARAKEPEWLNQVDMKVLFGSLFYRQNSRTRTEVARREIMWRKSNPLWPSEDNRRPCAAIHARHGDKLLPYWINAAHTVESGYNRTFDEYLDEALELMRAFGSPSTRQDPLPLVFVMSDDADIMERAAKSTRAHTFHVDPGHLLHSLKEELSWGTAANWLLNKIGKDAPLVDWGYKEVSSEDMLAWLVSIRLMSTCDYFVGNIDSGFTSYIYASICEQRLGNCPRATTLGLIERQDPIFNVDIKLPRVVKPAVGFGRKGQSRRRSHADWFLK